jgi:hypothetical protein
MKRSEALGIGWCCVDCLMFLANGEAPEQDTEDWIAAFNKRNEGTEITLGMLADGHSSDCPNLAEDGSWLGGEECYCEQHDFSWSQCDTCGSTLGGSRDAVTFWPAGS